MALYFTFILAGSILFAFVYFYSIRSQRAKRAKLDQRLDKMVVDEMLKPSAPDGKSSQSIGSNVSAVAPAIKDNDQLSSKASEVINVPVFEDETPQDEKTLEVFESNDSTKIREEPVLQVKEQTSSPTPSVSDGNEPTLSVGSAMKPRSQPLEQTNEPKVQGQTVETSSAGNAEVKPVDENDLGQASLFEDPKQTSNEDNVASDDASNMGGKRTTVAERAAAKKVSWDERECELVAKVLGENAISRDEILAIFRKYDFLLARKLHIFGFNTLTQMWSDVEREDVSAVFTDLGVSVQLADKSGALTRKELNTVSQLVLEYAESYNRQFSFSMDLDEAIEIGRELDELGRRHSSMVVLNIVPKRKEGFRSSDIDSCTRDLNMSQSDEGVFTRYRRTNNRSSSLYYVAVADETGQFRPVKKQSPFRVHDIVVYLNVPTVENPTDAFSNMVDEARKLATWLDGKLVDKHRRNMTTKGVNLLKGQVAEIEQNMRNDGIAPGGVLSHKLF